MKEYSYELLMKVRDYECDLQGIVNNANYQHYLEHTRHEFLLSIGLSFAEMSAAGYDFVVSNSTHSFMSLEKVLNVYSIKKLFVFLMGRYALEER